MSILGIQTWNAPTLVELLLIAQNWHRMKSSSTNRPFSSFCHMLPFPHFSESQKATWQDLWSPGNQTSHSQPHFLLEEVRLIPWPNMWATLEVPALKLCCLHSIVFKWLSYLLFVNSDLTCSELKTAYLPQPNSIDTDHCSRLHSYLCDRDIFLFKPGEEKNISTSCKYLHK